MVLALGNIVDNSIRAFASTDDGAMWFGAMASPGWR